MAKYLIFTVEFIFGFLALILLIRFYISGGPYERSSRLSLLLNNLSNKIVEPLNKFIPHLWQMELSSLFLAYIVLITEIILIFELRGMQVFTLYKLVILVILIQGILEILIISIHIYTFIIIAGVIMSWFRQQVPQIGIIQYYFSRLLWPIRKFVPTIRDIDLSPLVAIFLAQIILIAVNDFNNLINSGF